MSCPHGFIPLSLQSLATVAEPEHKKFVSDFNDDGSFVGCFFLGWYSNKDNKKWKPIFHSSRTSKKNRNAFGKNEFSVLWNVNYLRSGKKMQILDHTPQILLCRTGVHVCFKESMSSQKCRKRGKHVFETMFSHKWYFQLQMNFQWEHIFFKRNGFTIVRIICVIFGFQRLFGPTVLIAVVVCVHMNQNVV